MSLPRSDVRIRAPGLEDIEARIALGVSAEINRMYGFLGASQSRMTRTDAKAWLRRLKSHPFAWVIDANQRLVGEARLDDVNRADCRARLAIGLYSESDLGRQIGRSAITLVLRHAFGTLGLHRIDLRVLSYNRRAIRCYEACGFVREGVERQSARVGDEWHDDWIMAILEQDFVDPGKT